jgi:sigma-B regulation protein RsbU (phosphoserine phosphatase)
VISLGELRIEASLESLRTISYFLHGIGRRLQLTEKSLFEIELAVEEAATNIINYAYPPGLLPPSEAAGRSHSDGAEDAVQHRLKGGEVGDLLLRVEMQDDLVYITLTDWGIPLDPDDVKPFDVQAPIETRAQGGMGLHLIQKLMDAVVRKTSTALGGPNTLTLTKHIERLQPGAHLPSSLREFSAMRSVSEVLATRIDLEDVLDLIINKLVETIGAERGTLYLVDESTGELFSRVLLEHKSILKEIHVKIGEGIAGHVAATGEVLNIRDAYKDPRFLQVFDQTTGYQTHTILAAPLRNPQGTIIGVVQLLNKTGGPFTFRDERLLTAMAAQAAISIENARLYEQELQQQLTNQELETARGIQKSFLPKSVPQHVGWDIAAFWRPMRDVAGDFYDFYSLPDGRLAVVIADVSGKGVPAALFMALTTTVLRFAMSLGFPPDELLDHANLAIIADQRSKMFATVFVGFLALDSGSMEFASAGHNPPLLHRAAKGHCESLEASGVAMGLFKSADFVSETVTLAEGDVLVLYTDGITEATNAAEEEFGEKRLENLIRQNANLSAQELAQLIITAAAAFSQDQGAIDDETLVVIKRLSNAV